MPDRVARNLTWVRERIRRASDRAAKEWLVRHCPKLVSRIGLEWFVDEEKFNAFLLSNEGEAALSAPPAGAPRPRGKKARAAPDTLDRAVRRVRGQG